MDFLKMVKDFFKKQAIKRFITYLAYANKKNIIRLTKFVEKMTPLPEDKERIRIVRRYFEQDHPSVKYALKVLHDLHPNCRDKFSVNFILNHLLIANGVREKFRVEEGFQPPMTILVSPTMRCNLRCTGCYASEYGKEQDMEPELFNKIIKEGKEIGCYFYTILGGEPFLYKPLFEIMKEHNDAYFQIFTNATLIDEAILKNLTRLGNAAIMTSVEGSEEETDARRGKGVYQKIMEAMDGLRSAGILSGFSVCVTKNNVESVTSDRFIDLMIEKGAYIGWYFLYMPVGRNPSTELMPTPQQRLYLKQRRDYIRDNKPIFIIDFWNDAPFVRGCIAGRQFIHINSKGDIEPCIFMHFATHNIKNTGLREVLKSSPFFKFIKNLQPYNDNLYLPCTIIDNPDVLRSAVKTTRPYPTHEGAESIVNDSGICLDLDRYSQEVGMVYKEVRNEEVLKGMWKTAIKETQEKRAGKIKD